MADIPMELLERYRNLVRDTSDIGTATLQLQIAAAQPRTADELKAIVRNTLRATDAQMSEIDRQFYGKCRQVATGNAREPNAAIDRSWEYGLDRAIDAMLREHGTYDPETGEYVITEQDMFESDLSQYFGRMANESSKRYMEVYGSADPMQPRYARVPSGAETCAWCYALAGLGYQYKSAEAASHSHSGCDCVVVPSWGGSGVEGYDPEYYADMFRDARIDLRSGNVSEKVLERIDREKERKGRDYDVGWNGVLAVMRSQHDLK